MEDSIQYDNSKPLAGKVALITGGAGGMGAAQAALFIAHGAEVAIADINDERGKELAQQLGDKALYLHLDVSEESDWLEAVDAVQQRFGRVNVLVHNAGISPKPKNIEQLTVAEYERVIRINQLGTFLAIKSLIEPMKTAGGGSIITLASTAAIDGVSGLSPYSSSKFAVRSLTKVAALELAREGVRVNTIIPGPIDTEMNRETGAWGFDLRPLFAKSNPMGRMGSADEIAYMASFLASDASSFCTGGEYPVDGGQGAGVLFDME